MHQSLGNPLRKETPFTKTDLEGVTEQSEELGAAMAAVMGEGAEQLPQGEDWSHETREELEMTPREKIEKDFDDAIDEAMAEVPAVDETDINNSANRGLGLSAIANALSEAGRFSEVEDILKENSFDLHVASGIYANLAVALVKRGDIKGAKNYFKHLTEGGDGFFVQTEIAKYQIAAELDPSEALTAAVANALYAREYQEQASDLAKIAAIEQSAGLNGEKRFEQALFKAGAITDKAARAKSIIDVADAEAQAGVDNSLALEMVDQIIRATDSTDRDDFATITIAAALKGDFDTAMAGLSAPNEFRDETAFADTCTFVGTIQLRNKLEPTAFALAEKAMTKSASDFAERAFQIGIAEIKLKHGLDASRNIELAVSNVKKIKPGNSYIPFYAAKIAGLKRQAALAALEKAK